MKAYKISRRGETPFYVPADNAELKKNGKLEYWVYGIGRKETKCFEEVDLDIKEPSTLAEVAKIAYDYGTEFAMPHYERITGSCTLVSRHQCNYFVLDYMDHIVASGAELADPEVVNSIYYNIVGVFDIIVFEKRLAKMNPGYDIENCTYNGHTASLRTFIEEQYGTPTMEFVESMLAPE